MVCGLAFLLDYVVGSSFIFLCDRKIIKLRMSDRETFLSAIESVIFLNEEAGVNNESLVYIILVRAVSEGRQKADFDLFCKDIMTCIHKSLRHFERVLPHLKGTWGLPPSQAEVHTSYMVVIYSSYWTTN